MGWLVRVFFERNNVFVATGAVLVLTSPLPAPGGV